MELPTPFDASTVAPVSPHGASTAAPSSEAERLAATRYRFVPADMRATPCWMVARIVMGDNGKALKVPHRVTRGTGGGLIVLALAKGEGHNDPSTHCTFADAMEAIVADPTLELGFALGTGNDFACVDLDDLDKVAPEHREGAIEQHRLIREGLTPLTYSEVSRSGKGWHFIGRWPDSPPDLNRKKHAKFEAELLVRQFLVVTGDHRANVQGATTAVAEIGGKFDGVYRWILAGDGPATGVATLPVDATITPARYSEKQLIARLGGNWIHGPAFHDGRKAVDWSKSLFVIMESAATVCTDEQLVYRIISQSGLVRLGDDKGNESRLEKLNRLWAQDWPKVLIKTEPARRGNASSDAGAVDLDRVYTRADLWQDEHKHVLNQYVIHLVRKEAERMIRDELHSNSSSEVIAPLFLYITPRERGNLADQYLKAEQMELASACTNAQIAASRLSDRVTDQLIDDSELKVTELDEYMNKAVRWVHRDRNFDHLKKWFDEHFYIVKNHFGKSVVFNCNDPDAPPQALSDFHGAFSEYVFFGEIDYKKDELKAKPFTRAWVAMAGQHQYLSARMMYDTTAPSVETPTGAIKNLFTGFAVDPDAGLIDSGHGWPLISTHLWRVICSENPEKADYLIKYLAHLIQRPWELPKAAIALYSEAQGAGKSQLVVLVKELIGAKYCFETSDPKHVFGQFTSSTMEKLVIHGAEMLATVDDASNAKAKNIITDEFVALEGKHKDVKTARNYARLFLTTNKRHAVQIEASDRRFLVLRVSAMFGPTHSFWDAYYPNERTGYLGYRAELPAFMRYLRDLDISNFNPRAIPQTAEKGEQKLLSLKGANELLFTILSEGQLPIWSERQGNSVHGDVWVTPLAEWKRWLKLQPNLKGVPSQVGLIFKPITDGNNRTMRMSIGGIDRGQVPGSYHCTCLPPLAEARRRFLDNLGIPAHDWGDDPDCEWNRG
jgi:hypothetical protein